MDKVIQKIDNEISTKLNSLKGYETVIIEKELEIQRMKDTFDTMRNQIQDMFSKDIKEFNIHMLEKLLDRINGTLNDELERKDMEPEIVNVGGNSSSDIDNDMNQSDDAMKDDDSIKTSSNDKKMTKDQLLKSMTLDILLELSESTILQSIDEKLSSYINANILSPRLDDFESQVKDKKDLLEIVRNEVELQLKEVNRIQKENGGDNKCLGAVETLNLVQSSIWKVNNDGGVYDHLANDAVVVYGDEWTSITYQDSSSTEDIGDDSYGTLGAYHHYIPEDWERLLPDGWKDIDVSTIPNFFKDSSFWHSFPLPLKKILSWPTGVSLQSKPPETIMSPNNHIGSCWAMKGQSGKITLRLGNPISIHNVTIDHYPGLPSAHDVNDEEGNVINSSAPRYFRVVGYPSCEEKDLDSLDCLKLGFNRKKPILLGSFEYKRVLSNVSVESDDAQAEYPRRSTQSFVLASAAISSSSSSSCNANVPSCSMEDTQSGDMPESPRVEGSCTSDMSSCGESSDIPVVAAVSFFIDENWGNENFTCIYRIRVHGE